MATFRVLRPMTHSDKPLVKGDEIELHPADGAILAERGFVAEKRAQRGKSK